MGWWFLTLLFITATAVWILAGRLERNVTAWSVPEEVHILPSTDGWKITLHRYRCSPDRNSSGPVILCHGLAANRFNFVFPGFSLAGFLSEQGFDCWVLELRGAGWSRPGGPSGNRYRDWNLDDFIRGDIPAAVDHVCRVTGSRSVSWVGHSLGGTLALPYMAENPGRIRSAVLLASPSFTGLDQHLLWRLVRDLGPMAGWIPLVPVRVFSRMLSPLLFLAGVPLKKIMGWPAWENVENMTSRRLGRLYSTATSDVSRGMILQAARSIKAKRFLSADGMQDYSSDRSRIQDPVRIVASGGDRIIPFQDVEDNFTEISAGSKTFLRLDRSSGARAHYGHVDILFGNTSPREVYPLVEGWLKSAS